MKDSLLEFVCENMMATLTIIFLFSLTTIITFAATNDLPAQSPMTGELFAAATSLAYGYAASYIFYVINVFFPQKISDKKKAIELNSLLETIETSAQRIAKKSNCHEIEVKSTKIFIESRLKSFYSLASNEISAIAFETVQLSIEMWEASTAPTQVDILGYAHGIYNFYEQLDKKKGSRLATYMCNESKILAELLELNGHEE